MEFDADADALYVRLADGTVARTVQIDAGTLIDVDDCGTVLGVEVLRPTLPA